MISEYVKKDYDSVVKKTFPHKHEVQRFFLYHERKDLFCNNLTNELKMCELQGVLHTREQIKNLVKDMSKIYFRNCLNHSEQKLKSAFHQLLDERGNAIKRNDDGTPEMPEGCVEIGRNDTIEEIKKKVDGN